MRTVSRAPGRDAEAAGRALYPGQYGETITAKAASSAPELEGDVVSLEARDGLAEPLRDLACLALVEVDEDERLRRRDHEGVVARAVRSGLVGRARAADAGDADEHLELVVEDRGRVVLDRARTHHELHAGLADLHPEDAQLAVVLDAREVDVREVTAVVHDPLCVRVGEADARPRAELERRPHARPCRCITSASTSCGSACTVVPPRPVIVSAARSAFTIACSVASIAA